ncbi:Tyrosine recombinase XerC [subsurface metagenome]
MSIKPIRTGTDKWKVVVSMGKSGNGERLRHVETATGKYPDAIRRRNELEALRDKGVASPQARFTLGEHLRNWLAGYVQSQCSPRTIDSYESIAERHIIPNLGHIQLRQLTHQMIQEYYAQAEKTLTPRTVAKHHRLCSQALKYAVRQGYLVRNPCDLVDCPRWTPKEMKAMTTEEVAQFLEAAGSSRFYPVFFTAVNTGLRQAELCGLRWRDVNLTLKGISVSQTLLKRKGITVFKSPKTKLSSRFIAISQNLTDYLTEYKGEKESLYWHLGGPMPLDSLVFGELNKPCDPSALSHNFQVVARKAGLDGFVFHSLRHTFATLSLGQGASPKTISTMLGHASVAFTLQVYAKFIPAEGERAAALLNDILPAGVNKNSVTKLSPDLT